MNIKQQLQAGAHTVAAKAATISGQTVGYSQRTWAHFQPSVQKIQQDPAHAPELFAVAAVTELKPIAAQRSLGMATIIPFTTIGINAASGFFGAAGLPAAVLAIWWAQAEIALRSAHQHTPHRSDEALAGDLLYLWGIVDSAEEGYDVITGKTQPLWRITASQNKVVLGKMIIGLATRAARKKGTKTGAKSIPGLAIAANTAFAAKEIGEFYTRSHHYYKELAKTPAGQPPTVTVLDDDA